MLTHSEDKREPSRVTQLFLIFYLTKFKLSTWHFWFLPSAGYRVCTKHPVSPSVSPENLAATSWGCLPIVLPLLLWLWHHRESRGVAEQTQCSATEAGSYCCFCISGGDCLLLACCCTKLILQRMTGEEVIYWQYLVVKNIQQEWIIQLTSAPGIRVRGQRRQRLELKLKRKNLKPTDLCGKIKSN